MKKIIIAVVIILSLAGAVAVYWRHQAFVTKSPTPVVVKPTLEPAKTEPDVTESMPAVTPGYVIGILAVSKSVATESISMKVTNTDTGSLELNPNKQFKIVGLTSKSVREPQPEKTTAGFAGTIAPNENRSGIIYFDTLNDEQSELRFYPDPAAATYIPVPLIPLPEDQR